MVKTELGHDRSCLDREHHSHQHPTIKSSPYIRRLQDVIGTFGAGDEEEKAESEDAPCLVFEWMENVLWKVRSDAFRQNLILPKVIAKSVLSALNLLDTEYDAIHSGQ